MRTALTVLSYLVVGVMAGVTVTVLGIEVVEGNAGVIGALSAYVTAAALWWLVAGRERT